MTDDLTASIGTMRDIVAKLREHSDIPPADRDRLVEILEEQIREMEREREGAWS